MEKYIYSRCSLNIIICFPSSLNHPFARVRWLMAFRFCFIHQITGTLNSICCFAVLLICHFVDLLICSFAVFLVFKLGQLVREAAKNLILIQKLFWKDDIEKVKINIMEDSFRTNFVQKKLWRFFKDNTELNCDTKTILKKLHWKSKN